MRILVVAFLIVACSSCTHIKADEFRVYYVSFHARYYSPPTPGDIEKYGFMVDMSSKSLSELYQEVSDKNIGSVEEGYTVGLRVKIIRKSDKKIVWITQDKKIFSDGKRYQTGKNLVDAAINDIEKHLDLKYENWRTDIEHVNVTTIPL